MELVPTDKDIDEIAFLTTFIRNRVQNTQQEKVKSEVRELTTEEKIFDAVEALEVMEDCEWTTLDTNEKTGLYLQARIKTCTIQDSEDRQDTTTYPSLQLVTRFVTKEDIASSEKPVLTLIFASNGLMDLLVTHGVHDLRENTIELAHIKNMDRQSIRQILDIQTHLLDPLYELVVPSYSEQ